MISKFMNRGTNDEDLAHGQIVIIAARWILVVAGLILVLWNPGSMVDLQVSVPLILAMGVANFFLHSQLLMRGPLRPTVVYAASLADIAVISTIIIVLGSFPSNVYVFYLPALLAMSVTFKTRVVAAYSTVTTATYGLIALGTGGSDEPEVIVTQLTMMVATVVCGNLYWRMEGSRRQVAAETEETFLRQISDDRNQVTYVGKE